MRMMIIALGAVLVLGGGAAGAYFYFSQKADASVGPEGQAQEVAHDEKAKGGGHGEAALSFVELDPLILPIVDNTGVSQTVSMVIAIEVPDAAAAESVKHMTPKLKDAYIQDMYGALSRHAALKGGVLQVSDLKDRLNKITLKIMGEHVVNDVLLQVVQQRPI